MLIQVFQKSYNIKFGLLLIGNTSKTMMRINYLIGWKE